LAEDYAMSHPGVTFEFGSGTNTGGGVQGVADGTLDLGVANRALTPEETELGVGFHTFAVDATVFAVRLPNTVVSLTSDQVRALYSGEVIDWVELGGEPANVFLLGRDPDESATRQFFNPIMTGRRVSPLMTVLDRSSEMLDALEGTRGSIGFTSLGLLRIGGSDLIAPVALDGVEASAASIDDGTYPWVTTLAIVTPPQGFSRTVADFIKYVVSVEARSTLAMYGYGSS
jgi:phosphate transport system substrate-binding protein